MNMIKLPITAALAAACVLTLAIATAKASTVTFDVSANLSCAGLCTLGGNIVLDTTAGTVVSEDVTVTGDLPPIFGPFTMNAGVSSFGGTVTELQIDDANFNFLELFIPVSNLVGYTGGPICNFFSTPCGGGGLGSLILTNFNSAISVTAGTLAAETPLPAALPLFATGLGLIAIAGWRRKATLNRVDRTLRAHR